MKKLGIILLCILILSSVAFGKTKKVETLNFDCKDLKGNRVTEEIFKDYSLTMINVWGTFCSPCVGEMPDIEKLYQYYQDKGVNTFVLLEL